MGTSSHILTMNISFLSEDFIFSGHIAFLSCFCRIKSGKKKKLYQPLLVNLGFPGGSVVKNPLAKAGDLSLIPGSGKIP